MRLVYGRRSRSQHTLRANEGQNCGSGLLLAVQVLVYCFRTVLAVAHPLMPFVTERLWATLPAQRPQLLITSQWPSHKGAVDQQALAQYQV